MIHAKNLNLSFGSQAIFNDLSFTIEQDQRVALVGANGSGKSTLLKAIAGLQHLDSGTISIVNNGSIAYMPQDVILTSEKPVYEEAFCTFEKMYALQQEEKKIQKSVSAPNGTPSSSAKAAEDESGKEIILERLAQIHQELMELEPHKCERKTKEVLEGLGFSAKQLKQPVSQLSVGWKMRLVLAKLLLKNADFYLFDEPTNHLDLVAKDWFLDFLKNSSFGFILVCHDRYFLDQLCQDTIALELAKGKRYKGNYSFYEKQRDHELAALQTAYEQQQREIKQKIKTINRFRAKSTKAKMAKSMQKELDKVERIVLPPSQKQVNFSFPPVKRAGRIVLSVKNVAHNFGPQTIFSNATFDIERGQKVALVAPNGTGKSTLFNIICGKLPLQKGDVQLGYNVQHALFAQDQNQSLNLDETIFQNVQECCANKPESAIRKFLGSFLFSGEDIDKKVGVLSGGEKNRVSMVCVLLQDANFLLLDEPTNHLDIQSKEVLLKALHAYEGTILFVSHDRDFINRLATDIIELEPNGTKKYHGNYDSYLYLSGQTNSGKAQSKNKKSEKQKTSFNKKLHELRKKSKKLENKIEKLENEITSLELKFVDFKYGTPEFLENQSNIKNLHEKIQNVTDEWEMLQKKIENTG